VNIERTNALRLSVFGDREVAGREARNRFPIRVSDDDIDYDSANVRVKHQAAVFNFLRIGVRRQLRNCWSSLSDNAPHK
jgi:hypothetical protein